MNSSRKPAVPRSKKSKQRLDALLVERGHADSLKKAQALILARRVFVAGQPAASAGQTVAPGASIEVQSGPRYVSRGGDKLGGALAAFGIDPSGKVCLDVGSSTGGFTDCLLQAGARRVFAVDVGQHQLDAKLRADPRVDAFEGENFRHFDVSRLPERPVLATVDVSFISLRTILPTLAAALDTEGELVALVKPQFEAGPRDAPGGVVRDEAVRRKILDTMRKAVESAGFTFRGEADSVLKGPKGNQETFIDLVKR